MDPFKCDEIAVDIINLLSSKDVIVADVNEIFDHAMKLILLNAVTKKIE